MATHSALPGKHLSLHQQGNGGRHHHHRKSTGSGSHKLLAVIALLAVVVIFAAGAFLMRPNSQSPATVSPEAFVDQMEKAAQGVAFDRTVYGGPLRVESRGGAVVVIAENVPPPVCVSVGWKLVRKGLLSINGVTPLRVSAAKLSELCNQDETSATLTWSPKPGDAN